MAQVEAPVVLELDDIQNEAVQPRPTPYVGVYILLRIDDRHAGRELLRRLIPALGDATSQADRSQQAWISAGLTFQGLKALGVPRDSLVRHSSGMLVRTPPRIGSSRSDPRMSMSG